MERTITIADTKTCVEAMNAIAGLPQDSSYKVVICQNEIDRTAAQNRLAFAWYKEAASQIEGETAALQRAYCKLHFGVGILKAGTSKICENFRDQYDRIIRPLTYEQKIELMLPPIELPITSLMTVKQFKSYLQAMEEHYSGQNIRLTHPPDVYELAMR